MLEREHPRIQLASANLQKDVVNLHLLVESADALFLTLALIKHNFEKILLHIIGM